MKPVTIKSEPKQILQAFKASSYWMQLTKALQTQAAKDPIVWLESHPYLFSWYPSFFQDARDYIKPTKRRRQGAMRQLAKPRRKAKRR